MRNTPNYGLPQFEPNDDFNIADFNEAYKKLDEVVGDLQETFNLGASTEATTVNEVIQGRMGKNSLKEFNNSIIDNLTPLDIKITRHEKTLADGLKCSYTLTTIPYTNQDGTVNVLKKATHGGFAQANTQGYPRNLAITKNAVWASNASAFIKETDGTYKLEGLQIMDGQKIAPQFIKVRATGHTLGIKSDGTFKIYKHSEHTQDTMIADGVVNSFAFFNGIIIDGVPQTLEQMNAIYTASGERHPRNVIAQKPDKTVFMLTTEGRRLNEAGMTLVEVQEILTSLGCTQAYNLDGGGSSQVFYNGTMVNCPTDVSLGFVERMTPDIIYVEKTNLEPKHNSEMRRWAIFEKRLFEVINEFKQYGSDKVTTLDGMFNVNSLSDVGQNLINIKSKIMNNVNTGIQIIVNNSVKLKLSLSDTFLRYHNYETNKTILRVLDSGDIETTKCNYGIFGKTPKIITNVYDISEGGLYWCTQTTTNRPPSSTTSCLILATGDFNTFAKLVAFEWNSEKQWTLSKNGNGYGSWVSCSTGYTHTTLFDAGASTVMSGDITLTQSLANFKSLIVCTGNLSDGTSSSFTYTTLPNSNFVTGLVIGGTTMSGKTKLTFVNNTTLTVTSTNDKIRAIYGIKDL